MIDRIAFIDNDRALEAAHRPLHDGVVWIGEIPFRLPSTITHDAEQPANTPERAADGQINLRTCPESSLEHKRPSVRL